MEHTNLFLFQSKAAMEEAYPDGKITSPDPAVAYARGGEGEEYSVIFNNKVTNYIVTLLLQDKSGSTIAESVSAQTPDVFEGQTVKFKVVAPEVDGYKAKKETEKIEVSGDTEHVVTYLSKTDFVVTVHHVFSGETLSADTQVLVEDVWEDTPTKVTIEPLAIEGYTASPVTITITGSCEYTLEYEEASYQAIDLGLPSGTLWASCNVGASSPEQYGNYYAWGELEPKSTYTPENYRWYTGVDTEFSKYNSTDELYELEAVDDVANVEMGGEWRIPTDLQLEELIGNTTSSWATDYDGTGVAGVILTSNNNGNSIFLPAAGGKQGSETIPGAVTIWSSYLRERDTGRSFALFCSEDDFDITGVPRFIGVSVRGVLGAGPSPGPLDPIN